VGGGGGGGGAIGEGKGNGTIGEGKGDRERRACMPDAGIHGNSTHDAYTHIPIPISNLLSFATLRTTPRS
jgi:hypothetical protein